MCRMSMWCTYCEPGFSIIILEYLHWIMLLGEAAEIKKNLLLLFPIDCCSRCVHCVEDMPCRLSRCYSNVCSDLHLSLFILSMADMTEKGKKNDGNRGGERGEVQKSRVH